MLARVGQALKCSSHPRGQRGGSRRGGGVEPIGQRIELGAFLGDTAEPYGPEEIVGRAVQGQREQVFVATNTGGSWWRFCTSG